MRAARLASALLLSTLFAATSAQADILPDGAKGVRLSIRVDGDVPAGQSLVLGHTFRGADVLTPGKVSPVEWHPLGGELRLVLVKSSELPKLEQAHKDMNRDVANAVTDAGTPCGDAFAGVRTLPDTSPADEVRWIFTIKAEGGACTSTLVRTEYFTKDGAPTSFRPGEPVPSAAPDAPEPGSTSEPGATPEPAPPAPGVPSSTPSPSSAVTPAGSCGTCAVGHGTQAAGGALLLVAAMAALGLRRRKA